MGLTVRNYILFLFTSVLIAGPSASAQNASSGCVLKIFVNDPFAKIYVDDKEIGAQPQMVTCSIAEKQIVVKSSDGQVFSRTMKSAAEFDVTNTTLNVVFHRKVQGYVYDEVDANAPEKTAAVEETIVTEDFLPRKPPVRDLSSTPQEVSKDKPAPHPLAGVYVQVFALKTLDMNKVEEDIEKFGNAKISQQNITVCPSQNWSRILMGPFSDKTSALDFRSLVGGTSFVVSAPGCKGGFTRVGR